MESPSDALAQHDDAITMMAFLAFWMGRPRLYGSCFTAKRMAVCGAQYVDASKTDVCVALKLLYYSY